MCQLHCPVCFLAGLKVTCNATGKTVEIKPSIANSTNIHHMIVQNGSSFSCMCSVLNRNLSLGNVRWKSKELNLNQTLSNSGESLLTVSQVGWRLNDSVFECGSDHGGNGVPRVAFRLVVGGKFVDNLLSLKLVCCHKYVSL